MRLHMAVDKGPMNWRSCLVRIEQAHHFGCQEPGEGASRASFSCASTALVVVGSETPGGGADLCRLLTVCQELVPARACLLVQEKTAK
jgi:hypothetical protein